MSSVTGFPLIFVGPLNSALVKGIPASKTDTFSSYLLSRPPANKQVAQPTGDPGVSLPLLKVWGHHWDFPYSGTRGSGGPWE